MPSIEHQAPAPPSSNNGGPRLRTVMGNRYPRKCAGCGQPIRVAPDVRTVVDFGRPRPYPAYHAEHSPDAGKWRGNGSNGSAPIIPTQPNGGNGHSTGFTPASALPTAPPEQPKTPEPPRGPSPPPLTLLGSAGAGEPAPSASSGVAWATSQLTFNAGPYESDKSGFADYLSGDRRCGPGN